MSSQECSWIRSVSRTAVRDPMHALVHNEGKCNLRESAVLQLSVP